MSDTPHTTEYYKSELIEKDKIIEKLIQEVNDLKDKQKEHIPENIWQSREQELENKLKELSKINSNLKIENETLKLENEELLKQREFKVEEIETSDGKRKSDDINCREISSLSQESTQEKVKTETVTSASEPEIVIPEGIKTGNLQKQSQVFKTFGKFYFVLTKDQLHYYKSSDDPSSQKSIDLLPDCNVKIIEKSIFELETNTRTFKLIADSEEECNSWIKEINECIVSSDKEQLTSGKKTEDTTKLEVPKSENIYKQKPVITEGIKSGHLQKQSSFLRTFHQRYFVLTEDQKLYYYRSSNDPSNQKSIDLSECCKVKIGEGAKFELETKTKTYKLIADSEEERDSWVKELVNCGVSITSSEKIEETTQIKASNSETDIQQSVDNATTDVVEVSA